MNTPLNVTAYGAVNDGVATNTTAIMQNASCGVRTLIACQLRFSTSTIAIYLLLVCHVEFVSSVNNNIFDFQ